MITNYHTHTFRCRHAKGSDREYVENALENGIKVLGFSDHAPYPTDSIGDHRMRMKQEEAEDYVKSICALKDEYKGQIDIKLGFEAEYFPALYDDFKKFISQFPIDYMILGEHFIPDEKNGIYVGLPTNKKEDLILYVDLCIEALDTGDFSYVAHPDLINYPHTEKVYVEQMNRLLAKMKQKNIPAEFNIAGFSSYRHYPNKTFFSLVKDAGVQVIMGSDAHFPQHCGDQKSAEKGVKFLAEMGIKPIDYAELIKPNV